MSNPESQRILITLSPSDGASGGGATGGDGLSGGGCFPLLGADFGLGGGTSGGALGSGCGGKDGLGGATTSVSS